MLVLMSEGSNVKRFGMLLFVLSVAGCQTPVGSMTASTQTAPAGSPVDCEKGRVLLGYYMTPHQRADLIESMKAQGCRDDE